MKIDSNSKGLITVNTIIEFEDNKITTYYNGYKILEKVTRSSILGHTLTRNLYGISVKKFFVAENPEYTMEGSIDIKFSFGDDILAYRIISFCNSSLRIITVQYADDDKMEIYALYHMNFEGTYIVYFDPKKQTGNIVYQLKDKSIITKMYFRYYGNPLDMCWIPIKITEGDHKLVFKDSKKGMCMVSDGDDRYGISVIYPEHTVVHLTFIPFIPVELNGTVTIFRDENFWELDFIDLNKVTVTYVLDEDEYLSSMDQLSVTIEPQITYKEDLYEKQSCCSG